MDMEDLLAISYGEPVDEFFLKSSAASVKLMAVGAEITLKQQSAYFAAVAKDDWKKARSAAKAMIKSYTKILKQAEKIDDNDWGDVALAVINFIKSNPIQKALTAVNAVRTKTVPFTTNNRSGTINFCKAQIKWCEVQIGLADKMIAKEKEKKKQEAEKARQEKKDRRSKK